MGFPMRGRPRCGSVCGSRNLGFGGCASAGGCLLASALCSPGSWPWSICRPITCQPTLRRRTDSDGPHCPCFRLLAHAPMRNVAGDAGGQDGWMGTDGWMAYKLQRSMGKNASRRWEASWGSGRLFAIGFPYFSKSALAFPSLGAPGVQPADNRCSASVDGSGDAEGPRHSDRHCPQNFGDSARAGGTGGAKVRYWVR